MGKHTYTNPVGAADMFTAGRAVDLGGDITMHGLVLVERFTAPSTALIDRPIELIHEIDNRRYLGTDFDDDLVDLTEELQSYLAEELVVPNLVTQIGDQYYGERAAGIAGPPGQVTGMKLGTGVTAVAKTGAGAALVTYKSGSHKAIDGSFPTSALNGSSRQIQWKVSWTAGVINGSALSEVVIINDALADATSTAAFTISRSLFGPMTLGATDTLSVTWNHLLLGA